MRAADAVVPSRAALRDARARRAIRIALTEFPCVARCRAKRGECTGKPAASAHANATSSSGSQTRGGHIARCGWALLPPGAQSALYRDDLVRALARFDSVVPERRELHRALLDADPPRPRAGDVRDERSCGGRACSERERGENEERLHRSGVSRGLSDRRGDGCHAAARRPPNFALLKRRSITSLRHQLRRVASRPVERTLR